MDYLVDLDFTVEHNFYLIHLYQYSVMMKKRTNCMFNSYAHIEQSHLDLVSVYIFLVQRNPSLEWEIIRCTRLGWSREAFHCCA